MTSTTPTPHVTDDLTSLAAPEPTPPVSCPPGDSLAAEVRGDFPLLSAPENAGLVYLDSAATSQRPHQVIDAVSRFYEETNANAARGVYELAEQATRTVAATRAAVARFIGASDPDEIIFTKNATEALNLVAHSWGRANLVPGDAIVLSLLEHHANIVPWQIIAADLGIEIRWIGLTDDAQLDLSNLDDLLDGAKLVGVTAMSNVAATLPPVAEICARARAAGVISVVDACQSVPHGATDVGRLGCDFLAFSAHKMCGPTGVGVLWGRKELLDAMPPFLGGGGMIQNVTTDGFTPAEVPARFEAGTQPLAEIAGLGAAIDYLERIGPQRLAAHESFLVRYGLRTLTERLGDRLTIHGPADPGMRGAVFSLAVRDVHPHDLAQILNERRVCVRAGHHCAKPLLAALGVGATARASVYLYNDTSDIDALADALVAASDFFAL